MRQLDDLYPTRGECERVLDRRDPVVYGDGGPAGLTEEQLKSYAEDGYLIIPGAFSAKEVAALRDAYQRLEADQALADRSEMIFEPESRELRSVFAPHRLDAVFDHLSRDRRILDPVRRILGGEVYIHQGRINIKRALEGKSFPWHSDFETWHAEDGLPRMRVLTAWVMLTRNTPSNGPLFLVPGSHKRFISCAGETPESHHEQSLRRQEYGVPSVAALRAFMDETGVQGVFGDPGTLVLHEGNILHGSPDNITPWPRTNVFFVYNSVDNRPADAPFGAPAFRPDFLADRTAESVAPADGGIV